MKYRFLYSKIHKVTKKTSAYSQVFPSKRECLEQAQRTIVDLESDRQFELDELSIFPVD